MDRPPVTGRSLLGGFIAAERRRRGLSHRELAGLVRQSDRTLPTHEKTLRRWEAGDVPRPAALRALAVALGDPVEHLVQLAHPQPAAAAVEAVELPPAAAADHRYVETVHDTIRHLVALEVVGGGDEVAPLAARSFQSVRRRLAAGNHPRHLDRDLTAAAGELAEVAAWLLHDADQQEAAQQLNVEALYLSRLAGDRSIELLTMCNMAFVSLFLRRPGEALMLARAAQDGGRLTNRQRVIFQLREARALAQLGDGTSALRLAEAAASAFEDGATGEDPKWSWWVDTSEVMGHVAWTLVEAGQPRRAGPILQRSVEACPAAHANNHLFRLARYLGAAVDAKAWSDAEEVARRVPAPGGRGAVGPGRPPAVEVHRPDGG
jgi:transcriptional regulator with XRE-family HTH domain